MRISFLILIIGMLIASCSSNSRKEYNLASLDEQNQLQLDTLKLTNGFDFPVGKPNATKYYNAQKFGENNHLGDDWNGVRGGNTDFGDPIYAIGNGYVTHAKNIHGGWGNVIRIVHYIGKERMVESLYAHCNEILVKKGAFVKKGQKIGTIGNNDGQYLAHLHFEIRSKVGMPIGAGYSSNTEGYIDPTRFIKNNRSIK